jgi:hypothetical protein
MPAQAGKLTEAQLGVLTAYVWGLSNKPGARSQALNTGPSGPVCGVRKVCRPCAPSG